MAYVSSSGVISEKQPWGLAKLIALFWGFLNFFFMFFRTLVNPGGHARGDRYTQDFRGPGGGSGPHRVTSETDLANKLRQAGSKLVVIDFYATWCGPCQWLAPMIEELAARTPDVVFLKVDVDECDTVAAKYSVRSMPTLVFVKNGRQLASFAGADFSKLQDPGPAGPKPPKFSRRLGRLGRMSDIGASPCANGACGM